MQSTPFSLGIYEKALPEGYSWSDRFDTAKKAGYDFIEMSIDESKRRMDRLDWSPAIRKKLRQEAEHYGIQLMSICLSAHRKYPLGSSDPKIRQHGFELLKKAIELAIDTNIQLILVPGYDVFYEDSTPETQKRFIDSLFQATEIAEKSQMMLALENTDKHITSISQTTNIINELSSPWFQLYGDIGNLVAAGHDMFSELEIGAGKLAGIHLKDAKLGHFRYIEFGEGDVPFSALFDKLFDISFKGPLMLELLEDPNQEPLQRILSARTWIQDVIDSKSILIEGQE